MSSLMVPTLRVGGRGAGRRGVRCTIIVPATTMTARVLMSGV